MWPPPAWVITQAISAAMASSTTITHTRSNPVTCCDFRGRLSVERGTVWRLVGAAAYCAG